MEQNINIQDHFERIISRLSQHIQNQYKINLKYFTAEQWTDLDISAQVNILPSLEPISVSVISNEENILLPISVNGELSGVVKLVNGTKLTAEQIQNITELVDGVVGGTTSMVQKIQALEDFRDAKLNDLNSDLVYGANDENVVQLSRFSYLRKNHEEEIPREQFATDMPIFIHAKTHEQIYKIAHQAYSHTNKIACLSFADLTKGKTITNELLNDLGPICVYIPEVADLSKEVIGMLTDFLLERNKTKNDNTLFIFGSTGSGSQLLRDKKISLNFYRLISELRLNHLEDTLSQDQLTVYAESLLLSQKDLHVMTLLSQVGVAAFNVDELI